MGGFADFSLNSLISIFLCKSTTKDCEISADIPMCSHVDHPEHSVKVLITEQGIADLRGTNPHQHAREISNNCAHPD
jgi:succinyl-CoA:acetate CoA-transferase